MVDFDLSGENQYDPIKPKGGTRKIKEPPGVVPCGHPQHDPPSHMVFQPGLYEHECPACGAKQTFRVNRITM